MSALKLFCDVIQTEMALADDQVYLWDQKIDIPPDDRLYIAVAAADPKPFGSSRKFDPSGSGLIENLAVNMYCNLTVDIFSKGSDARDRKEEVILALQSSFSRNTQAANTFFIAPLSNAFANLSGIEGAAIPYRYQIQIAIQYFISKTKSVPYYNTFLPIPLVTEP